MRKSNIAVILTVAALAGCAGPTLTISNGGSEIGIRRPITTTAGAPTRVSFIAPLNPDCTLAGPTPVVRVSQSPAHGTLEVKQISDFPNFPSANSLAKCNTQRVAGIAVTYQARAGFVGEDSFTYEYFTSTGRAITQSITASVR